MDQINESFYYRLNERFPDLTVSEKRLCSMLALELSTKNIATLLNISEDSVKKARYRLRQKFELTRSESLTKFLRDI